MNPLNKLPEHFIRLSIVILILIVGTILIRAYVVPPSLKDRELHQSSTIEREMAKEIKYVGSAKCIDCHDNEYHLKKSSGYHRDLSCETCHGPAYQHVEDPAITPPAPRDRKFCPLCHIYDPARPTGFPQINPVSHNPMDPCIKCHDPHDPKPPETPRECTACHGEIARTKAVSHHALLECTTCHNVPGKHKISPRVVKPTKPETREFCGKCHAEDSAAIGPPKINLITHGEKYLCWQCHYPHLPEVR